MASRGLRFDRFYAGSPVCSPTRGSCLTGRHPFRYGLDWALGAGQKVREPRLRKEERTVAQSLRNRDYATGHFGKWHLGAREVNGRKVPTPGEHGFEEWFSTEYGVPTYNPMVVPPNLRLPTPSYYHNGALVTENLAGDTSRIIMDRAIRFIARAANDKRRFLAVIWFHAPHWPVFATPEFVRYYRELAPGYQAYYSCLSAVDAQIGRLRAELRRLRVADNTMLWYTSDNGPEGREVSEAFPGSAGPFRGRKRSLFEGGIRVPGILEWPSRLGRAGRATNVPCVTHDYYPTIREAAGADPRDQDRPMDGVSLLPLIESQMKKRPKPIAFETLGNRELTLGSPRLALIDNRYKLLSDLDAYPDALFDLVEDPGETHDLARHQAAAVFRMRTQLAAFRASCRRSFEYGDYPPQHPTEKPPERK